MGQNEERFTVKKSECCIPYRRDGLLIACVPGCRPCSTYDDVIKWKHFPRYWPILRGIHRSPVNSPHKGQWRGALLFSLICVGMNGWVNNREAGDLRHYRAHYAVTIMNTGHCNILHTEYFKSHYIYPSYPVKTLIPFQIKRILYWHSTGNFTCPEVGPDNTNSVYIDHSLGCPFIETYIARIVCLLSTLLHSLHLNDWHPHSVGNVEIHHYASCNWGTCERGCAVDARSHTGAWQKWPTFCIRHLRIYVYLLE